MATSPSPPLARDRLSDLPDEVLLAILSHLPPRLGARTVALSRRFRHLWRLCPSLHLLGARLPDFLPLVRGALFDRSAPLLTLRLDLSAFASPHTVPHVSDMLVKARSLGTRHLSIEHFPLTHLARQLPAIFSISSLHSLTLCCCTDTDAFDYIPEPLPFPSASSLTRLTSLQFHLRHSDQVRLLSHLASTLPSLENVFLKTDAVTVGSFRLSSRTVRNLRLSILADDSILDSVKLSIPSLESFCLETWGCFHPLPRIHGRVPNLRKAVLAVSRLHPEDVSVLVELLEFCKPAKELSLNVKECKVINILNIISYVPSSDLSTRKKHVFV